MSSLQLSCYRINIIDPNVDSPAFVWPADHRLTSQHHRNVVSTEHGKAGLLADDCVDVKPEFISEKSDCWLHRAAVDIQYRRASL